MKFNSQARSTHTASESAQDNLTGALGEVCVRDSADHLLGGAVRLAQPPVGYRVAIDPVLLAAAIPIQDGQSLLDIGAGVGAALLCVLARKPAIRAVGVEVHGHLAQLANENLRCNGFQEQAHVLTCDLSSLNSPDSALNSDSDRDQTYGQIGAAVIEPASFDHVISNPPFFKKNSGTPSRYVTKQISHMEGDVGLSEWFRVAAQCVRPKGTVTLIHTAARLDETLALCRRWRLGHIKVFPLWPGAGKPAKRVLIQATRNHGGSTALLPGLVLHRDNGTYTSAAAAILSAPRALDLL